VIAADDLGEGTAPKPLGNLREHGIRREPLGPKIVRLTQVAPIHLTA